MALALLGQKGVQVLLNHIKDSQPIVSEYPVLPLAEGRNFVQNLQKNWLKILKK
jgi:hypothetical protein